MRGKNSSMDGLPSGLGDLWTDMLRPALTAGAGHLMTNVVQSNPNLQNSMIEAGTQSSVTKMLTWVKANPGKSAAIGIGSVALIAMTGVLGYRAVTRR